MRRSRERRSLGNRTAVNPRPDGRKGNGGAENRAGLEEQARPYEEKVTANADSSSA